MKNTGKPYGCTHTHTHTPYLLWKGGSLFITSFLHFGAKEEVKSD